MFNEQTRAEIREIVREEFDERDRKFVERFEQDSNANLYTELFEELREVIADSKPTQH